MSCTDHATLAAWIAGVDKVATEHEREWGVGRLEYLADDELRAKFARQMVKWREALEAAYDYPADRPIPVAIMEAAQEAGGGVKRGWLALSTRARLEGFEPIEATIWEVALENGFVAALVRTNAEAAKVLDDGRYKSVYTLDEVANIFAANLAPALQEAKRVFPGATLSVGRGGTAWIAKGDAIPFGDTVDVV